MTARALLLLLLLAASSALAETNRLVQDLAGGAPVDPELVERTQASAEDRARYFAALGELSAADATKVLRRLAAVDTPAARGLLAQSGYQAARSTRLAAIEVLPEALGAEAADPLLKLSRATEFEISEAAILALGYLKARKAWHPLLTRLQWELRNEQDGTSSPPKSGAIVKALATLLGDLQEPALLGTLLDAIPGLDRDYEREGACLLKVIADSKSPLGVPVLLAVLNDPPRKDMRNSILEFRWDPETSRALERAFGEDGGSLLEVRPLPAEWKALAAQGLGQAGSARAFPFLLRALKHRDPAVRLAALRALSPCMLSPRDPQAMHEALDAVIPLLTDATHPVRNYAWRWLKRETKQELPLSYPAWRRWNLRRNAKTLAEEQ